MFASKASPAEAEPGFYLIVRERGFAAYVTAGSACLSRLRSLAEAKLTAFGVTGSVVWDVQVVLSELFGNAVRACGETAPLVVDLIVDPDGVWVKLHDPDPEHAAMRPQAVVEVDQAEGGRGLHIVDVLAPEWHVVVTPIGKQVLALVPFAAGARHFA